MRPDGFFEEYRVAIHGVTNHHTHASRAYYRFSSIELHGSSADEFFKSNFVKVNIREFPDLQRLLGAQVRLEAINRYNLLDVNQADL